MSRDNQTPLVVGAMVALVVSGALFYLRFCGPVAMPERPPPPSLLEMEAAQAAAVLDRSQSVFAQRLTGDSKRFHVSPPATVDDLSKVFPHQSSDRRVELTPGKGRPVEIAGLKLQAVKEGRVLALRIENTADHPVAYRVEVRPERGVRRCRGKETLRHNAMALREKGHPDSTVIRSECSYSRGKGLTVTKVETVALPPLSFHYVSRLEPSSVGLTAASVNGHRPPEGGTCRRTLSATLESQLRSGETTWRDMVDFYARHSCEHYRFPSDYKAFEQDGARELPAVEAE